MEEIDHIKIILAVLAIFSFVFNIYQYFKSAGKFKVSMGMKNVINANGAGLYLAGHVAISNVGDKPMYFGGLKINTKEDNYFPLSTFKTGVKIEPHSSITGHIPISHLIDNEAKELIVMDGIWREYKVPKKMFNKVLSELEVERNRLVELGFPVDPVADLNIEETK